MKSIAKQISGTGTKKVKKAKKSEFWNTSVPSDFNFTELTDYKLYICFPSQDTENQDFCFL